MSISFLLSLRFRLLPICFLTFSLLIFSCNPKSYEEPNVSLENYQIEEGFNLKVIASEPFLEAPVAMDFDNSGRMWVVELKGYMPNLEGTGDHLPSGSITILEDLDNDGVTDHSKVFLDSLVLPRAIAHVYDGLLYAVPPNLWFVDIKDDKPVNRILVDSLYSEGGNVEHQPNGLMMHTDNWIYSAKSNYRYQRKNGKWLKESTTLRGQWGITKDNFGRLYYNNNSTQLIGDYVLPNTIIQNEYFKPKAAVNHSLTPNQRVYPLHPTSVNRGYQKGILDKDSILINVTSACGPLIYRGGLFGKEYDENAFVPVPEGNLIKRLKLSFDSLQTKATPIWENKEFIASTDEGFRPVNMFNGPDGNMYIVDMHRGIIQDKAFLTPYLHDHMAAKKLDTIVGMGRILKVTSKKNPANKIKAIGKLTIPELVDLLKSNNGWLRDRAQQLLVYKNKKDAIPLLKKLLEDKENSIAQIHAMYTLAGIDALEFDTLKSMLNVESENSVLIHALVLLENFANGDRVDYMINIINELRLKNDSEIDLYLALTMDKWIAFDEDRFFSVLFELTNKYQDKAIYQEAIVSSLDNMEQKFLEFLQTSKIKDSTVLVQLLENTIQNINIDKKNAIYTSTSVGTDSRTAGYKIFRNYCATCHGVDGEGIDGLAPPLKNSEYVTESSKKLALIILHGLAGPIHVNGKLYELNNTMPGLANNRDFTDKDIRNIISYMNNAFPSTSKRIKVEDIKELREQKPENGVFSEEELLKIKD
ncbi:c-type cytochrome [Kriegella sp. EG-1]|nr:c-type cytochrome [Flavobacteriaceae bacterium EG-1]